jgi:tripartite-type tricarboxylate transporter receptor subunit TctC
MAARNRSADSLSGARCRHSRPSSLARSPAAPELPTLSESGLPGFEVLNWMGVIAPARMPADIMSRLNGDIRAILQSSDVRERLLKQGLEPAPMTPEAFDMLIRSEIARWSAVVKEAGIKPD